MGVHLIDKKQGILKAAQRVFAQFGYHKTTMDDIAEASGLKKASLYYYYSSKEDIFRDVIITESQEFLQKLTETIAPIPDPRDKIIRYLRFRMEYFQTMVNLHRLTVQAILELKPLVERLYQQYMEDEIHLLVDILRQGVQSGDFRPCDEEKVARAILTLSEAIKFREFHTTNAISATDLDYSKITEEILYLTTLILDGLQCENATKSGGTTRAD